MIVGVVHFRGQNLGDELFWLRWQELFARRAQVRQATLDQDLGQYDRLVIGGGDLLNLGDYLEDYWSPRYLERPTFVYGVGACGGQDQDTTDRLAGFLRRCRAVYVRDRDSADTLARMQVPCAGVVHDLLWAGSLPSIRPAQDWSGAIGLVLRVEYGSSRGGRF